MYDGYASKVRIHGWLLVVDHVFAVLRRVYIYLRVGVAFLGRSPTHLLYKGHLSVSLVLFHVSCFLVWTD